MNRPLYPLEVGVEQLKKGGFQCGEEWLSAVSCTSQ